MNFSGKYKDLIHLEKLHVISVSVFIDKLEATNGGIGANIAYNYAQLGDSPILLGSVGKDASAYIEELKGVGINTDHVFYSDLPTASFNVLTDGDDNQIGGFYPGAMFDSKTLTLDKWVDQEAFLVISAHDPNAMRAQAEQAKQLGIRYMYDPGQQVSNLDGADMKAGVTGAEILSVNDYELSVLCDKTDSTTEQLKTTIPIVLTTYGKDGSVIEGTKTKEPIRVHATKPAKVVDPTGAGDSYRAGFLYGYLRQWDLLTCGQLGSVFASFIVEKHGTQQIVAKEDIIKRYQETFNERIEL